MKKFKVDKLDIKIIDILAENSRITYKELAERLNVPRQRVARKLRRLERAGIIKKYTVIPDFEKLNYVYASLGITLKPGAPIDEIIERLKKDKDVKVIERGIGSHDIILRVAIPKSLRGMEDKIYNIIKEIGEVDKVDKTIITEISKFETL